MELFLLIVVLGIGTRYAVRYNFHMQKKPMTLQKNNPLDIDKNIFLKGVELIAIHNSHLQKIVSVLEQSMVWAKGYIHSLLAAYIAKWHVIIQWPPWTWKTLLVKSFAKVCDLLYQRIQCTPDLLPQDILGSEMLHKDTQQLSFLQWPIFANVVHVDEINRTTPKLQSAFLEWMQEWQVTAFWKTYKLPQPFFLIATQNPYDAMWTYLLPYAQVDRFMIGITTNNIDEETEIQLIKNQSSQSDILQDKIISHEIVEAFSGAIDSIQLSDELLQYAVSCIQHAKNQWLQLSVRTSQSLVWFVKAIAYMQWRKEVIKQDIQLSLLPVLKHRIDYLVGHYVSEEKIYEIMIWALKKDDIVG